MKEGILQRARECCGFFSRLALAISASPLSVHSVARVRSGSTSPRNPGVPARNTTSVPDSSSDFTSLSPSATNRRSWFLNFLCSSDLISLILFLPSIKMIFLKIKPKTETQHGSVDYFCENRMKLHDTHDPIVPFRTFCRCTPVFIVHGFMHGNQVCSRRRTPVEQG